jgi:predicted MPP superfamily phosphohydrolase
MARKRQSQNGPVKKYRFKSVEHRDLFDAGKLTFEEATEEVTTREPVVIGLDMARKLKQLHKNYVYPDQLDPSFNVFMVTDIRNGLVSMYKYFYTSGRNEQLLTLASCNHLIIYAIKKEED